MIMGADFFRAFFSFFRTLAVRAMGAILVGKFKKLKR
jgi:hypothetical protein